MTTREQLSTRRASHFLVDASLTVLALALVALVLAVTPGPEACRLSLPTPGPCFADDRNLIALITIVSVLLIVGAAFVANHLLSDRARRATLAVAAVTALAVGLLGASSLVFDYWIIHPYWQLRSSL